MKVAEVTGGHWRFLRSPKSLEVTEVAEVNAVAGVTRLPRFTGGC